MVSAVTCFRLPAIGLAPGRRARFSLIERPPSKGGGYILTESVNPANFPIQAGSLTSAGIRATGSQAGWQSRETGNSPGMAKRLGRSLETGSQQNAGRLNREKQPVGAARQTRGP